MFFFKYTLSMKMYRTNHLNLTINYTVFCCKLLQTLILFDILHRNVKQKSSEISRLLIFDAVYIDKYTIFYIQFDSL